MARPRCPAPTPGWPPSTSGTTSAQAVLCTPAGWCLRPTASPPGEQLWPESQTPTPSLKPSTHPLPIYPSTHRPPHSIPHPSPAHRPILTRFCLTITHVSPRLPTYPHPLVAQLPVPHRPSDSGGTQHSVRCWTGRLQRPAPSLPRWLSPPRPRPRTLDCQAVWVGREGSWSTGSACAVGAMGGTVPCADPTPAPPPSSGQRRWHQGAQRLGGSAQSAASGQGRRAGAVS